MATFIKYRPTVLDQLPLEVIREEVFPNLNYEDRISLNMCLPVWDRIPRKMSKQSIEKHEQSLIVDIISTYLLRHEQTYNDIPTQIKNTIRLFKLLQMPRYFIVIKRHTEFRNTVLKKIRDLLEQLINLRTPVELGIRLNLASELKKLRNKIDTSGPYHDVSFTGVNPLSFH